jgi:hypothetical protein
MLTLYIVDRGDGLEVGFQDIIYHISDYLSKFLFTLNLTLILTRTLYLKLNRILSLNFEYLSFIPSPTGPNH